MDTCEIYRRASAEFAARVHAVGGRWDAPTPLPGWDVRQLVAHLVEEQAWAPPLFGGSTIEQVGDRFAGDLLGPDPVRAFDAASAAALAAVTEAGALRRTVHLSFGDQPGEEYTMQLATDHLVHAWDLARALGADERLDPEVVTAVREWFAGMERTYREVGAIGPRVELPDGADEQSRLLAMTGRRP